MGKERLMGSDTYKVLMFADPHMSNRLPFSVPGERDVTDRMRDQVKLVSRINEVAEKEKVDATFILGDLFDHSRVDAVTLTHTIKALTGTKVPMYILAGNHDANNIRGGRFTVEAFGAMEHKLIRFLDSEIAPREWLQFLPVPYMPVAEAEKKIKEARKLRAKGATNVLLFHNSVLGCDHLDWTCDDGLDPDFVCKGFDWSIGGHFHTPQRFGPKNKGMYLGAPMHHHFGDRERPAGFWIIKFKKGGKRKTEFFEGHAPKFHVIDYKEFGDETTVWASGDYYRVEVEATHSQWSKMKAKMHAACDALPKSLHIQIKHKPIYHHKKRLKGDKSDSIEGVTIDKAVHDYVDAASVVTTGLSKKRLKELGKSVLDSVRDKNGTV